MSNGAATAPASLPVFDALLIAPNTSPSDSAGVTRWTITTITTITTSITTMPAPTPTPTPTSTAQAQTVWVIAASAAVGIAVSTSEQSDVVDGGIEQVANHVHVEHHLGTSDDVHDTDERDERRHLADRPANAESVAKRRDQAQPAQTARGHVLAVRSMRNPPNRGKNRAGHRERRAVDGETGGR